MRAKIWIVIEGFDHVGKFSPIFPAKQSAGGLGPPSDGVGTGDEMNSGNQMHKKISGQAFPIILKASPAKKSHRIEGTLRRTIQEGSPVNRLLAGVRRNRVDPSSARGVSVPIGFNRTHLAEFPGVIDFLGSGVKNG